MLRGQFSSYEAPFLRKRFVGGKNACPRNMLNYIPLAWVRASWSGDWPQFSISPRVFFSRKISPLFYVAIRFAFTSLRTVLATCALCVHTNDCPRFTLPKLCAGLYSLWKTGNNSPTSFPEEERGPWERGWQVPGEVDDDVTWEPHSRGGDEEKNIAVLDVRKLLLCETSPVVRVGA